MEGSPWFKVGIMADDIIAILLSTGHSVVHKEGGEGMTEAHLEAVLFTADIANKHIKCIQWVRAYSI